MAIYIHTKAAHVTWRQRLDDTGQAVLPPRPCSRLGHTLWAGNHRLPWSRTIVVFAAAAIIAQIVSGPSVSDAQQYYFVVARHSGKCLHQHGGTASDGDPITQWDCVNQGNLKLEKVPAGDGYFYLRFQHSGKCLHQHGGLYANGAPITQWSCINQANLRLRERDAGDGYVFLQFQHSGKCVHQHGATRENGGAITQWDCVSAPNIQWRFVPAPQ